MIHIRDLISKFNESCEERIQSFLKKEYSSIIENLHDSILTFTEDENWNSGWYLNLIFHGYIRGKYETVKILFDGDKFITRDHSNFRDIEDYIHIINNAVNVFITVDPKSVKNIGSWDNAMNRVIASSDYIWGEIGFNNSVLTIKLFLKTDQLETPNFF